jgi:hypothetical protein
MARFARQFDFRQVYSIMLYMKDDPNKTRVTFRIDPQLAAALRTLPNQTLFVETALLEALGETCPLCDGKGRVPARRLKISDFRRHALPRLTAASAPRLREIVKLGHRLMATELKLRAAEKKSDGLSFELVRHAELLLSGRITAHSASDFVFHN